MDLVPRGVAIDTDQTVFGLAVLIGSQDDAHVVSSLDTWNWQ